MIRIGTAGWSVPSRHGESFVSEGSHLQRYARVLNCAEINSSFYRPHRESTWARWAESVPDGFRFSVKAPRAITHECELQPEASQLKEFFAQLAPLKSRLGAVLFQLPPAQEFAASCARSFLAAIRKQFSGKVVLEPRNASWFTVKADALLRKFSVSRCAADPARHAGAGSAGGDASLAYYRLHGSPRMYYSSYSDEFLAGLAQEIAASQVAETWVIFDNTAHNHALANALRLMELCGLR